MNGRKYFWIGCQNNKILFPSIDQLTTESVHVIIKRSNLITYIFNMIFGWSLDDKNILGEIIT